MRARSAGDSGVPPDAGSFASSSSARGTGEPSRSAIARRVTPSTQPRARSDHARAAPPVQVSATANARRPAGTIGVVPSQRAAVRPRPRLAVVRSAASPRTFSRQPSTGCGARIAPSCSAAATASTRPGSPRRSAAPSSPWRWSRATSRTRVARSACASERGGAPTPLERRAASAGLFVCAAIVAIGPNSAAIARVTSPAPGSSGVATASAASGSATRVWVDTPPRQASAETRVSRPGVRADSAGKRHAPGGSPSISTPTRVSRPTSGRNRPPRAAMAAPSSWNLRWACSMSHRPARSVASARTRSQICSDSSRARPWRSPTTTGSKRSRSWWRSSSDGCIQRVIRSSSPQYHQPAGEKVHHPCFDNQSSPPPGTVNGQLDERSLRTPGTNRICDSCGKLLRRRCLPTCTVADIYSRSGSPGLSARSFSITRSWREEFSTRRIECGTSAHPPDQQAMRDQRTACASSGSGTPAEPRAMESYGVLAHRNP